MRFSDVILLLNTLWFVAAFIQFSVAQVISRKTIAMTIRTLNGATR